MSHPNLRRKNLIDDKDKDSVEILYTTEDINKTSKLKIDLKNKYICLFHPYRP